MHDVPHQVRGASVEASTLIFLALISRARPLYFHGPHVGQFYLPATARRGCRCRLEV